MDRADTLFRAFADRTRLRILSLLRDGELCVGDLVELLDVPQPTTSRHLGSLRKSGLVACRKEGQWALYSLAEPADELQRRLLDCLEPCASEVKQLAQDARRARALRKKGGCCPEITYKEGRP